MRRSSLLMLGWATALLSCSGDDERLDGDSSRLAAPAAVSATPSSVAGTGSCPATGLWSECAVLERLDRAGLAPRRDSAATTEAPLAPAGTLVHVGRFQMELYVYPDAAARERDQSKLDRSKYLAYDAPIGMNAQPTLIHSANLIAILHSRNDHQRERVTDAIVAGPPQAPAAPPPPPPRRP
jgi:hypothetical protein